MPASDEKGAPIMALRAVAALTGAAALPHLMAALVYPINKGTVFVGVIALYIGVSLVLALLLSMFGLAIAIWVHFRKPEDRRRGWYTFFTGECAFAVLTLIAGTIVTIGLDGHVERGWSDVLFITFIAGFAVSLRKAIRG